MNTIFLAVLVIASSLFIASPFTVSHENTFSENVLPVDPVSIMDVTAVADVTISDWEKNAVQWLIDAQSSNGGWGAGSHAYQNVRDPHMVQTDPATTSFAAMALLKAGGALKDNPYRQHIMKALDRILQDVEGRPGNGRITSLDGTQPQRKLGINIDASMALQFLSEISDHIADKDLKIKTDAAAKTCIELIQQSQNTDGGWAGGGWAPVLQSAMANNALEKAQTKYDVDVTVMESSRKYQAENMSGENVRSDDAAGVPLYAAASAQRATSVEAKEASAILSPDILSAGTISETIVAKELQATGMQREKAERLAKSYVVNQASTKALQDEKIWEGFGNNGGEEYLSYLLTSESLAQQGQDEWKKWIESIEPKFKQAQNENGSWSGHHCITSPVFCTAAIIQTLNVSGK